MSVTEARMHRFYLSVNVQTNPAFAGSICLALAPLRPLAVLEETWLLALLRARVAGEEAGRLEGAAAPLLCFCDGASDRMTHRHCLGRDAASSDLRLHCVVLLHLHGAEDVHGHCFALLSLEILERGLAVHGHRVLRGGRELHTCGRGLPASDGGGIRVGFSHNED